MGQVRQVGMSKQEVRTRERESKGQLYRSAGQMREGARESGGPERAAMEETAKLFYSISWGGRGGVSAV